MPRNAHVSTLSSALSRRASAPSSLCSRRTPSRTSATRGRSNRCGSTETGCRALVTESTQRAEVAAAIQALQASGEAIAVFASGLSPTDAPWKPAADRWSTLEVLNHLADEEVED